MSIAIIIKTKINMEKQVLIYKLEGVRSEGGVDLYEIIPVLENLGLLIKESGKLSVNVGDFEVKVRPFKAGSFQIDLILREFISFLNSGEVSAVINLLEIIGVGYSVIKFVQGKVNQFKTNDKKQVVYYSSNGEEKIVDDKTHRFIQSETVQKAFYGAVTAPISKISDVTGVSIHDEERSGKEININKEDLQILETYNKTELDDDSNSIESRTEAYLKPARGSYSGEEKQYTFLSGDAKLYPTMIQDDDFINKLKSGEIRLFHEDILKVKLLTKQKMSKRTGKLSNEYVIEKVIEYDDTINRPRQMTML